MHNSPRYSYYMSLCTFVLLYFCCTLLSRYFAWACIISFSLRSLKFVLFYYFLSFYVSRVVNLLFLFFVLNHFYLHISFLFHISSRDLKDLRMEEQGLRDLEEKFNMVKAEHRYICIGRQHGVGEG